MLGLIWYLLSPFTLISFPKSRAAADTEDQENDNASDLQRQGLIQFQLGGNMPKMRAVNIPYYMQGELEDSVVLQMKSLSYVFHRFRIAELKPFLKMNIQTEQYDFDYFDSGTTASSKKSAGSGRATLINAKLDRVYNVEYFKDKLLNDPYRILFDYSKNKFRSLLILSQMPDSNTAIPTLKSTNFHFLVLRPEDPVETYIDVLVNKSGIFCEHKINNRIKVNILMRIINKQKREIMEEIDSNMESVITADHEDALGYTEADENADEEAGNRDIHNDQPSRTSSRKPQFSKDDRADIIRRYVEKLAFHIQVQRIYRAALKAKERELKNKLTKFTGENTIQSYRSLKSERSKMTFLPESSSSPLKNDPKLKGKPSISIMDLDESTNPNSNTTDYPYYSDTADSQASSSTSSVNLTKQFSQEEKHICFEQSKMAVRIRIERERASLY